MKNMSATACQVEEVDLMQQGFLRDHLADYPVSETTDLHIWRINLDDFFQVEHLASALSADEIAKADRLIIMEKRKRFMVGRSLLRWILSIYTNQDAHAIRFVYHRNGKPFLAENTFPRQLQFNLSHSGPWLVLVVSQGAPVGIDIEAIKLVKNKKWALEALFDSEIREKIRLLPDHLQDAAFIGVWTKMEAIGKTLGIGLNMGGYEIVMDCEQNLDLFDGTFKFTERPFWLIRFFPASNILEWLQSYQTGTYR